MNIIKIEQFKNLFKEFDLEIVFPLLDEEDDYAIKNKILAHGFVPKMSESQCLLGMPVVDNGVNKAIMDACVNVYIKELYPKIAEIIDAYKNINLAEKYI